MDLTGAKFAQYRGDAREAVASAQRAAFGLERLQTFGLAHIKELYLESLYEIGTALWNLGDRDQGHDYIVQAEGELRQTPGVDWRVRSHINLTLWKNRSRLLMSSKAWYPVSERLAGLTNVFENAYASGSLPPAMDALGVIAECNAFAHRRAEALRAAELAVTLAKQQANERMTTQVHIDVAAKLMRTEYWEDSLTFFSRVKRLENCEAFYRANAHYFMAARALRFRRFQEAWRLANVSAETARYADLALMQRLVAATAAHELGWQQEAHDMLEALIPESAALGSAPILRDAYDVAAVVNGDDSRSRRKARELSRLLAT
jgi:hypothetical protein